VLVFSGDALDVVMCAADVFSAPGLAWEEYRNLTPSH
jgi:hypothetical protein